MQKKYLTTPLNQTENIQSTKIVHTTLSVEKNFDS